MVKAVVVGGAAAPAVALALAKEHLAVLHDRTNAKIASNVDAAEEYLEDELDMAISEKIYELVLGGFDPCVELLPYNATAVESVKYVDALGATQTLDAAKYRLDIGKTGAVSLAASDVGAETPSGAQAKANQAEQNAKTYADQQLAAHSAETASKFTNINLNLS